MQIQHRVFFALPEPDQLRLLSESGHEVKRSGSVELRRALAFDVTRIGDVEHVQTGALLVFDIQQRSGIHCLMQEHRYAAAPESRSEVDEDGDVRVWAERE